MARKTPPPEQLSFDARGRPRWDKRTACGVYEAKPHDSPELLALKADEISLADTQRQRALNNPYGPSLGKEKPLKRRSRLDYMRALSEGIKAKRRVERVEEDTNGVLMRIRLWVLARLRGR